MHRMIILIFSAIAFVLFEIAKRKVIKKLIKKGIIITKITYRLINLTSYMLAGLAVGIFIIFTYAIPKEQERIKEGKECCIRIKGEVIDKKCKFQGIYKEETIELYDLADPGDIWYNTYCGTNAKKFQPTWMQEE